ncbi:hypothetical protein C8R44DRAFT_860955 [Mycena epipterygia]|nr:hypothetical protein C8R44DRAFT_860955 [Mycena epipterygia]
MTRDGGNSRVNTGEIILLPLKDADQPAYILINSQSPTTLVRNGDLGVGRTIGIDGGDQPIRRIANLGTSNGGSPRAENAPPPTAESPYCEAEKEWKSNAPGAQATESRRLDQVEQEHSLPVVCRRYSGDLPRRRERRDGPALSHNAYVTQLSGNTGGPDFGGFGGDDVEDGAVGGDDVHICADSQTVTWEEQPAVMAVFGGELYAVGLAHRSRDNIGQRRCEGETQAWIAHANTARTITPTLRFTRNRGVPGILTQ